MFIDFIVSVESTRVVGHCTTILVLMFPTMKVVHVNRNQIIYQKFALFRGLFSKSKHMDYILRMVND